MKIITVRQPYAWLIVAGFKDIENRKYRTSYRGTLVIQSSKRHIPADSELAAIEARHSIRILREQLQYGGIIGVATLIDCVSVSDSPWFQGPVGWKLKDQREVPFIAWTGMLALHSPTQIVQDQLAALGIRRQSVAQRLLFA